MTGSHLLRAVAAQGRAEVILTLRRGESILVTVVIPVLLLAFFASAGILPKDGRGIDFLLPGTLALAIISTSLVSLGIATAYERYYGVLKRLGATPFPRWGLVASKMLAVGAIEVAQIVLLASVAVVFFGWRPHGSIPLAVLTLILGTLAFSGLGLAMAGSLRAEATLAGANALFVVFLLIGGLFVPLGHLPGWLASVARILPADALAEVLRDILRSAAIPWASAAVLVFWAIALPLAAALTFRWE
jgi:ABC-2 type transport system permease protein